MKKILLTVVVNLHREGPWAAKAIRSAIAAAKKLLATRPDEAVEIVVVADRPDERTMQCARAAALPILSQSLGGNLSIQFTTIDLGDLGLARNHGVWTGSGRFVAFLDGDDLWGEDWPTLGVAALEKTCADMGGEWAAAHPCINVDFGDGSFWWTQPDQRSDEFDPSTFWVTNCWSSGAMAPRSLLMSQPYLPRTEGLGFEDWEWNARTMAGGTLHVSVPGAVVFIRKKNDGLNADSAKKKQLVAHSEYFESPPEMMPRHKKVPMPEKASGDWLNRQWKNINAIEPALWPDARRVQALPRYKAHPSPVVPGTAFLISRKVEGRPTHIILAPALVRGGADKRIVQYAAAVTRAGGRPLILTTDRPGDGSWGEPGVLPDGVHVVDAADLFKRCGNDTAVLAVTRLLMRWRPVVHVINSRLGYTILQRHGASIRDSGVSAIYCSLYGTESAPGQRLGGAAFNGWFEAAAKHVDRVLSDNHAHAMELMSVLCWDKTTVVPSVVGVLSSQDLAALATARAASKRPAVTRVLWASRMVRGKRLDRLLAVAKACHEAKLPILFAVAGEPLDRWSKKAVIELQALPNVRMSAKAFDGWGALSPAKHDLFVFTSESEGMPNVVLEALAHGLPVVSTSVGDVARLPPEGVRIVDDPDGSTAVEAWVKAIAEHAAQGKPIPEWIRSNHSTTVFDKALASAGYFDNIKGSTSGRDDQWTEGRNETGPGDAGGVAGEVVGPAADLHQG